MKLSPTTPGENRSDFRYQGKELELFANAVNWKSMLFDRLGPYIRGDVLEVGAGKGSTTKALLNSTVRSWTALEPDPTLVTCFKDQLPTLKPDMKINIVTGSINSLADSQMYDAILYIDVLEHISNDTSELQQASRHLKENGYLVVLAPAHQWLYSEFDKAIGHYRRYTCKSLGALTPAGCELERVLYLDSAGMLASCMNRVLLKQSMPTLNQIRFWDNFMVPISKVLDPISGFRFGKSVVAIWINGNSNRNQTAND